MWYLPSASRAVMSIVVRMQVKWLAHGHLTYASDPFSARAMQLGSLDDWLPKHPQAGVLNENAMPKIMFACPKCQILPVFLLFSSLF